MSQTAPKPLDDAWPCRLVSAGLRVESASLRVVLMITLVSGALLQVADRSDRGLPVLVFVGGQLLLSLTSALALMLFSIGPDWRMRRRARLAGWLVVAALALVAALLALTLWSHRLPWPGSAESVRTQMLALGCALFADLALLGGLWFDVHGALGRDLDDSRLTAYARSLTYVWAGACGVAATIFVAQLRRESFGVGFGLAVFVFGAVVVLESLSLILVQTARRAVGKWDQDLAGTQDDSRAGSGFT